MWNLVWLIAVVFRGSDGKEPTDRLVPAGWEGNAWGPAATRARARGEIPPIALTPTMKQWDRWGRAVLRDGDILFRRADARLLWGYFPFSRFLANVSGSPFSHTGIVALEGGEVVVYDTTKLSVRRQPFAVWMLDSVGPFGVKRVRPELRRAIPEALRFCREAFERQVPFDYELGSDNSALYCVEMTEKAYRASGLPLSHPVRLGDMENVTRFPIAIFVFSCITDLKPESEAFFPGNERHGIWSSPSLVQVYPPGNVLPSVPASQGMWGVRQRKVEARAPRPSTAGNPNRT